MDKVDMLYNEDLLEEFLGSLRKGSKTDHDTLQWHQFHP